MMVRAVVMVVVVGRLVAGRVCRVKVWHEAVVGDWIEMETELLEINCEKESVEAGQARGQASDPPSTYARAGGTCVHRCRQQKARAAVTRATAWAPMLL